MEIGGSQRDDGTIRFSACFRAFHGYEQGKGSAVYQVLYFNESMNQDIHKNCLSDVKHVMPPNYYQVSTKGSQLLVTTEWENNVETVLALT